jgi:hypothetical protein
MASAAKAILMMLAFFTFPPLCFYDLFLCPRQVFHCRAHVKTQVECVYSLALAIGKMYVLLIRQILCDGNKWARGVSFAAS